MDNDYPNSHRGICFNICWTISFAIMKNLLVITSFFSVSAFSNMYTLCEESHFFFSDLKKSVLIKFDLDRNEAVQIFLSPRGFELYELISDDFINDSGIFSWEDGSFSISTNGRYYSSPSFLFQQQNSHLPFGLKYCEIIDLNEYKETKKKLEDYSAKVNKNRKKFER